MKELVEIATYLAQAGHGKIIGMDKTIYVHHMPFSVKEGILLRLDYAGIPYDHEMPGYFKASFQVVVRNPDHVKGQTLAEAVTVTLNKERVAIGAMQVHYIRPETKPLVFPASEGDYLEFSTYYDACYTLTS